MGELWLIIALIFGAALLGFQASYVLIFRERKTQQSINRRLRLSSQGANPTDVFQALKVERGFTDFDRPGLGRFSDFWTQTGLRFDRNLLLIAVAGLAVLYFFALQFPLRGMWPLALALAVVAAIVTVYLFLHIVRKMRI